MFVLPLEIISRLHKDDVRRARMTVTMAPMNYRTKPTEAAAPILDFLAPSALPIDVAVVFPPP